MACSCSLFLILLTVTGCDREEDERFPSGHHDPIEGDGKMVPINVKVDGVDEFLGGAVTRSGEILTKIVQPLDSTYDSGYDVETTILSEYKSLSISSLREPVLKIGNGFVTC